mmetsp:Transcript_78738/g.236038  ORF Transcript_78738/g.236038 Transcript_78738/m.236038 type:complete len:329 (+) Transcript_78738:1185-2171(+)
MARREQLIRQVLARVLSRHVRAILDPITQEEPIDRLEGDGVPQDDRLISRRRCDAVGHRRVRARESPSIVAVHRPQRLGLCDDRAVRLLDEPHTHGVVAARRDDLIAVRVPRDTGDKVVVPFDGEYLVAVAHTPELHGLVVRGRREHVAVWRVGHFGDPVEVPQHVVRALLVAHPPQLHRRVGAARADEIVVRVERDRQRRERVGVHVVVDTAQLGDHGPALGGRRRVLVVLPDPHVVVVGPRADHLAAVRERDALHPLLVAREREQHVPRVVIPQLGRLVGGAREDHLAVRRECNAVHASAVALMIADVLEVLRNVVELLVHALRVR